MTWHGSNNGFVTHTSVIIIRQTMFTIIVIAHFTMTRITRGWRCFSFSTWTWTCRIRCWTKAKKPQTTSNQKQIIFDYFNVHSDKSDETNEPPFSRRSQRVWIRFFNRLISILAVELPIVFDDVPRSPDFERARTVRKA